MPIPQSQATLKSYFETGKIPTQAQFAEFIDTMFSIFNSATDAAETATAAADAATATVESLAPKVMANFTGIGVGVAPTIQAGSTNVASTAYITATGIGTGNATVTFRVTFTVPFANTNYKPLGSPTTLDYTKADNYVDVKVQFTAGMVVSLVILP